MANPIRLGTRGSPLALWQANHVAALLRSAAVERPIELVLIQTTGDRIGDRPLDQIGVDGLFTKEIQRAVQEGRADVAVHSLKDLPTLPVEGLELAAVPARGPTGDAMVSKRHPSFLALPQGATVGSGSLRRRAQLLYRRPDLKLANLRGNVETRLRKLEEEGLDAIILAEAGLHRLGLSQVITEICDPQWMLPAVGQGALGLECRSGDRDILAILARLDHYPTAVATLAERAFLHKLGGGCQVPIGAWTLVAENTLTLRGAVLSRGGEQRIAGETAGNLDQAESIGAALAKELLSQGAGELVQ
jgi:hydroxymethylbilane synthase